jgi:hypothetical protein
VLFTIFLLTKATSSLLIQNVLFQTFHSAQTTLQAKMFGQAVFQIHSPVLVNTVKEIGSQSVERVWLLHNGLDSWLLWANHALNPIIYSLSASDRAKTFHDVTVGNNGAYKAGTGWDAVTGWGSMQADALLDYLTQQ